MIISQPIFTYHLVQAELPSLGALFFCARPCFWPFFHVCFFPFLYYVIYSSCVIMHLIVLECVFVAKFNTILCFYTIFQKPISNTLHMVPYLGKQVSQPCYGHFCHISFFTNLITTDMYNASIMHTIVFLNIWSYLNQYSLII